MAGHSHWAGIKHKKGKLTSNAPKYFQNYQKKLQLQQNLGIKTLQ
jgi:transcriptional/translational regulatory protein YebC/TACO1